MKKFLIVLAAVFLLSACSMLSSFSVSRLTPDSLVDLSGYWNDNDVRIVCRSLIDSCLNSGRVDQAIRAMGGRTPTVIIGRFRNDSDEQIDTEIITSMMRTTIINSGKFEFAAAGDTRDALRAEREDQLLYASEDTAASLANETGADFMLTGSVKTIVDREGNQTVRTYFVTAELWNIETNTIIWTDQNSEIKKMIIRPKNKL